MEKLRIGLVAGKSGETIIKEIQKKNHDVVLLCGNKNDSGVKFANEVLVLDFNLSNTEEYVKIAYDYFIKQKIDAFVLGTGTWFAFEIAEMLLKSGIQISHNIDVSRVYKNKLNTKVEFEKFNYNTPSYNYTKKIDAQFVNSIDYPKVVKSNIDLFPVFLCKTKERLLQLADEYPSNIIEQGVLIEEYIEGNDITIPIVATRDSVRALGVFYWSKQHNYKLEGFDALLPILLSEDTQNDLLLRCERFIKDSKYFGVCRFDLRIGENDVYFLEINSVISIRNTGSSYLTMAKDGILLEELAVEAYIKNVSNSN